MMKGYVDLRLQLKINCGKYLMKLITNLIFEKRMITMSGVSHVNQCIQTAITHNTTKRAIRHRIVIAVLLTRWLFLS